MKRRKNQTGWNLNRVLWDNIVWHRRARFKCSLWLCACRRGEADSCVFSLIDTAVYVWTYWLSHSKIWRLRTRARFLMKARYREKSDNISLLLTRRTFQWESHGQDTKLPASQLLHERAPIACVQSRQTLHSSPLVSCYVIPNRHIEISNSLIVTTSRVVWKRFFF